LVVPGDEDPLCTIEASQAIDKEVSNSKLLPLTPAKHMGLVEHHDTFAKKVRKFGLAVLRGEQMKG
jgi:pimeloyl-ACP methyl ester carboxylesterase